MNGRKWARPTQRTAAGWTGSPVCFSNGCSSIRTLPARSMASSSARMNVSVSFGGSRDMHVGDCQRACLATPPPPNGQASRRRGSRRGGWCATPTPSGPCRRASAWRASRGIPESRRRIGLDHRRVAQRLRPTTRISLLVTCEPCLSTSSTETPTPVPRFSVTKRPGSIASSAQRAMCPAKVETWM